MSDGTLKVTFAEVQQAAQDITSSSNTIDQHLSDLKGKLAPIVAEWTGAAAEAYQAAQKQWDSAAADLNETLASIGIAVRQAGEGYSGAEDAAKKLWG